MPDKATLFLEDKLEIVFELLESGDFKSVKHILKKACKKYPRHYLSNYGEGMYLGFIGDHSKAIVCLQKSIKTYSTYALAHYSLAISYQEISRIDLALKHHIAALEHASSEELEVIGASKDFINTVENNLPAGVTL